MYPRLSDLLTDLFGIHSPVPIYSFGFMVAVAILTAGWFVGRELDRMYAVGLVRAVRETVRKKDALGREKTRETDASPSILVTTFVGLAAVLGIAGSKLFHILENLPEFFADPARLLFSSGGLTFYGGLIVATLGIAYYVKKKGLPVPRVADAIVPTVLLGYGLGRIGCYLSGDGDWGVCSTLANKPSWLPAPLWTETFPRNIIGPDQTPVDAIDYTMRAMQDAGMDASRCATATGVYPTMLYETAMCLVAFAVLWRLRKHRHGAGWLAGLALVLIGAERFLIELIRVNNVGTVFGIPATQAQVISVLMMLGGLAVVVRTMRRRPEATVAP